MQLKIKCFRLLTKQKDTSKSFGGVLFRPGVLDTPRFFDDTARVTTT